MAARISPSAVVRYFSGDDTALPEIFFEGSDDELGMEDQELDDSEPPFEPLEVEDQGEFTVMIHIYMWYYKTHQRQIYTLDTTAADFQQT